MYFHVAAIKMQKNDFYKELEKYPIIRDKSYQGRHSGFEYVSKSLNQAENDLNLPNKKKKLFKSKKESEKFKQVITHLQFFRTFNKLTNNQLTKEFIEQYSIMLRNLDLDSCEQILLAVQREKGNN